MAFSTSLVVLLAAVAMVAATNPSMDPFYHPTGRPAQNPAAGASSQTSPGFPQISKLLPLVQADTIGPTLNTALTKLIVTATWDFGNPALAPTNLFRPLAVGTPGGRRLMQTTNLTSSCIINDPSLGPNKNQADNTACALAASISANCTCTGVTGRKLLASHERSLLQTLPFVGRQQFFGECKEDFFTLLPQCNYVFDAASAGLRSSILTTIAGNKYLSCTLFYDDGSFVTSETCFSSGTDAPTVVRLNGKAIEYAKNPSSAGALAPGTRISPLTYLAANYQTPTGFLFSIVFRPVQTFGVYINEDGAVFPGQ